MLIGFRQVFDQQPLREHLGKALEERNEESSFGALEGWCSRQRKQQVQRPCGRGVPMCLRKSREASWSRAVGGALGEQRR